MFQAFCPRCDKKFIGQTRPLALFAVREHLKRAQGADMDDGLHDNALQQWDDTPDPQVPQQVPSA